METSIRRLIGSDANRSYLRALPAFKVETSLPPKLAALLDKLDHAEEQGAKRQQEI